MTDTDRALYGVLQELAGTDYASANYAGDIIESDMRRTARGRGQALPTAGDVATETFHGAVVFDPVAGLHNHVSYPDYSALYPNIMRDLNASPETIAAVGDTDAFTSEHDVSDMQWSYIDTRPVKRLRDDETYSDYTDGEYKIVYDPSQNSIKWRDDWRRIQDNLERIYFVPHEAYEGLLASRADTYIRWNKSYEGTMYKATKRTRNCFSADTEVLTPNGIQNIRELDVGDRVYSIDPDTMAVELKPVTETHHYPDYDGDVLSFKNTYVDFQVTDNHRMLVRDEKKRRGYEFVEAGNLGHKHWSLPSGWDYGENCTTVDTVDLSQRFEEYQVLVEPSVHGHTFANRLGWYPRRTQSKKWDVSSGYVIDSDAFESHRETVMENAERIFIHKQAGDGWVPLRYDGDDVIELVGWYVTEGSLYHEEGGVEHDTATRGESYRFSIAQKNDSGRDTIRSLLERMGLPYSTSGNGFTLANRLWHDLLERWCGDGSHEKHLPPYVFAASRDQRQLLFDTMVTGDGDTRDSSYRYTTCSEQLRDDFMRLCVTLGRAPHYTYDSGSWRVFYSESKNTLRPRRDGDVTTVDDGVYCVTVADNHTLMAGRNGKFQFCGQSLYGVSGDSNFQLFDWRVAEAITTAGRLLLEYGADVLTERLQSAFDAEVYVTHGDSVPADEPVLVRGGAGSVSVEPAHRVHERVMSGESLETWTEDGWTTVRRSIEKPNRKQMYEVRTKAGTVRVTEDHSLVRADGMEVSPEDVDVSDSLLVSDVGYALPSHDEPARLWSNECAWLLGLFVADGTAGHYEYDHRSDKHTWSIINENRQRLERAAEALEKCWGVSTAIRDTRESSGAWKLQVNDGWGDGILKRDEQGRVHGRRPGGRKELVGEFRDRCYVGDEKRVPPSILNGTDEEREAFLTGYLEGDGGELRYGIDEIPDEMTTKSRILGTQLAMLLRSQGHQVTVDRQHRHGNTYYRLRAVTYHHGDPAEVTDVDAVDYDGNHVYDFETENHHFHAGVGSIVVHNTDGFGVAVDDPTLDRTHVLPKVQDATAWLNDTGMPEYVAETFGVPASDTAHEVDLESYSPRLFIPDGDGDSGTKKTYAEHVTWDEGEECDDVSIKGFEAKRSDTANVTQAVQRDVLTAVLQHDPADAREIVEERVQDAVSSIESGDMSLADMGERSGMSSSPESYGSPERSAHPTYRGAKYAKAHIDGEETFDKPLKFPVKEVRGDYPSRYDTDTGEDGTAVDYVSVEDPSNLPDEIVVDREQVVDSTLRQPLRRVLCTMGWSWSEIVDSEQQTNVTQFFQT